MKMKIKFLAILLIVTLTSYNVYQNREKNRNLSSYFLANVEALVRYETPEVVISCNESKYTPPGRCWISEGDCMFAGSIIDDCIFIGYQKFSCITVCD